jgi:hypothetical protein
MQAKLAQSGFGTERKPVRYVDRHGLPNGGKDPRPQACIRYPFSNGQNRDEDLSRTRSKT